MSLEAIVLRVHAALLFLQRALIAIGLATILVTAAIYFSRAELAAWYRELPVVVAAKHCPQP